MNDEDLIRVLDHRADEALPPADLLASLDRRYSRWRVRTATLTGSVAVLVVAALVVTITAVQAGRRGGAQPADVLPPAVQFTVPTKVVESASVASVFPNATFQVPKETPDGRTVTFVAPIDRTHLLTFIDEDNSQYADFASYDLTTGTFGPDLSRVSIEWGAGSAYGARYWVWGSYTDANTQVISKVTLATGQVTPVATVSPDATGREAGWYTDDQWLYSSNATGVERLSLDGGSFRPVRGLEHFKMRTDSPWAVRTAPSPVPATTQTGPDRLGTSLGSVDTELRNVETGQVVHITAPPDAMGLACTPIICLGFDGTNSFIQRPDGSDRVFLPHVAIRAGAELDQPWRLLSTPSGALLVSYTLPAIFLDPYTGGYAVVGLNKDDMPLGGVGVSSDNGGANFSTTALYAGWSPHDGPAPGQNFDSSNPSNILLPGLLAGL
jgi:hypothetical protein